MEDNQEALLVEDYEAEPVKASDLPSKEIRIFLFEFLGMAVFAYG